MTQQSDAPQWTSEPPSEPGWYWVRDPDVEAVLGDDEPGVVSVSRHFDRVAGEYTDVLEVHRTGRLDGVALSRCADWGWLWWPIPLTPPEAP